MTFEEAINVLDDMKIKIKVPKQALTQNNRNEAIDMAIQALEQIKQIKEIINAPVYIQENVFRYQMICEVIRDDK